jgi:hypothetical protein
MFELQKGGAPGDERSVFHSARKLKVCEGAGHVERHCGRVRLRAHGRRNLHDERADHVLEGKTGAVSVRHQREAVAAKHGGRKFGGELRQASLGWRSKAEGGSGEFVATSFALGNSSFPNHETR